MLQCDMTKSYGKTVVLRQVRLNVAAGEIVGIFGPSGGGKSTLLRVIGFLERPTSGWVDLRVGEAVRRNDTNVGTRNKSVYPQISFVFQERFLWPHMTVKENVEIVRRSSFADEENVHQNCRELGLESVFDKFPNQCSVGQQQRAALARTLAARPKLLLMDELTASLDLHSVELMLGVLDREHRQNGTTMITVSHSPIFLGQLVEREYVLWEGQLLTPEAASERDDRALQGFMSLWARGRQC